MTNKLLLLLPLILTVAQAGIVTLESSALTTSNDSGNPTIDIPKNPVWADPLPGSSWISMLPTGDPASTGYTVVPNGTLVNFSQSFVLSGPVTGASLSVMADDTTSVILNGSVVFPATLNNPGQHCSAASIGCLSSTGKTVGLTDLQAYLQPGTNTLTFGVEQTALVSFGLDYAGTITTADMPLSAPEPASLALIGTGLIALGVVRRFRRTSRPR